MWDRFIDGVTVIWLALFFTGIAKPDLIPANVEFGLLSVFVADLVVKYRREPNFKTFIRRRWTDILMVIPYFRIFRILRLFRLIRILKVARIAKVRRFPGLKSLEALRRKSMRIITQFRSRHTP